MLFLASLLFVEGCDASDSNGKTTLALPTPTALQPRSQPVTAVAPIPEQNRYFPTTGQSISQPFLSFWLAYGGTKVFGYPISGRIKEKDPATGELYTAQYFERARFELHTSTGDKVVLGRLGAIMHPLQAAAKPRQDALFFRQTGHNLSATFRKFWNDNVGLPVFGYPTTEVLRERNPADGKVYHVQYFERARFELSLEYPGNVDKVQLGRLGAELYKRR